MIRPRSPADRTRRAARARRGSPALLELGVDHVAHGAELGGREVLVLEEGEDRPGAIAPEEALADALEDPPGEARGAAGRRIEEARAVLSTGDDALVVEPDEHRHDRG